MKCLAKIFLAFLFVQVAYAADYDYIELNPFTGNLDATRSDSSLEEVISLTDLDDVSLTSLADLNLLQYDSTTSNWVNRTIATILDGTYLKLDASNDPLTSSLDITGDLQVGGIGAPAVYWSPLVGDKFHAYAAFDEWYFTNYDENKVLIKVCADNIHIGDSKHAADLYVWGASTFRDDITVQVTDGSDSTIRLEATPHCIDISLDQSATNDNLLVEGQTALVNTNVVIRAQDGETAQLDLFSGLMDRTEIAIGGLGHFSTKNKVLNRNLVYGVNDGGVEKTVTWNASADKLEHSNGTFNFDDDNITTTGTGTFGDISGDNISVTAGSKLNIEGSGGDTYFIYNAGVLELWVDNVKVQEWD